MRFGSFQFGSFQFRPSLAGTLATLALLPVLVNLGMWQLRRADEKRALIAQYQAGTATTQHLSGRNAAELPLLQTVEAQGRYDSSRQVLLDNMPSARHVENGRVTGGLPGYQVLTPLQMDDGYLILVNRGWVALGATRSQLPDVAVDTAPRSLRGTLSDLPQPGLRLGPAEIADKTAPWPQVLNYTAIAEQRAQYGERLLHRIVLLAAEERDGFAREWSARYSFGDFGPEKHTGYAVQWFGLAAALLVIYGALSCKRVGQNS
jgi:surfeit locus 1 family protein